MGDIPVRARRKQVTVLNHFALPRSAAGGTRHVEMFGLLKGWKAQVVAGDRNVLDQSPVPSEGILVTVWTSPYTGNGVSRVLNWASYSMTAMGHLVRNPAPDVVYASSPHMGAALCGAVYSFARRRPLVVEVRDLWPHILVESGMLTEQSKIYKGLKSLERLLYRRADKIVILAEGSRSSIEAEGVDSDKIHFVPNGADVADFLSDADRDTLRGGLGFSGFVCVYAGAHGPANGLDQVLDAAESLRETHPEVSFVLYGDGAAKASLVEDARRRGLSTVDFRAPVPKDQIAQVFAAADVGLHCLADMELFKYGVSPNKLYDYMAAGLPVVTNAGGETADLVEKAGAGLACPPDQVAAAIAVLAESGEAQLARYGQAGREFMVAERSRQAMADQVEAILEAVVR